MDRINWDKVKATQKAVVLDSCIQDMTRNSYDSMLQRCYNPEATGYERYGGLGITVCERWLNNYEAFVADMGLRQDINLSLDRINPYGNYEPDNCRWATRVQQANNRRKPGFRGAVNTKVA